MRQRDSGDNFYPFSRYWPAMDALDLNLIPYLVALDDTRNVSRAGELLGVSQPRVSTALGRLRAYFGDPLFVRTSRGMRKSDYRCSVR